MLTCINILIDISEKSNKECFLFQWLTERPIALRFEEKVGIFLLYILPVFNKGYLWVLHLAKSIVTVWLKLIDWLIDWLMLSVKWVVFQPYSWREQ